MSNEQVLKLRKKKSTTKQRLALQAVQKQLQLLKLKEWLVIVGFIGGAALLRVPMQAFPNVEPLTFFAILAGWLFGKKKGFLVGASSLYISNFLVFGGQGPWTIFQVIGYGLVGFFGGFLRKKSGIIAAMSLAFLSTILLQIIFNIGWSMFIGFNFLVALLTALPFAIIHIISNTIFAAALPKTKKVVNKIGKFDEKEVCTDLISQLTRVSKQHK